MGEPDGVAHNELRYPAVGLSQCRQSLGPSAPLVSWYSVDIESKERRAILWKVLKLGHHTNMSTPL